MLDAMSLRPDTSGAPAETGTLLGAAVEMWHRMGDANAAFQAALDLGNTPEADVGKARAYFDGYCSDPRNAPLERDPSDGEYGGVVNDSLEMEILFELDGVWFSGHPDQARRLGSRVYLWDIKCTGRLSGANAVNHYAAQLAGYTYGIYLMLDEDVHTGGIIRATDYFLKAVREGTEEPTVFYRFIQPIERCRETVLGAVDVVHDLWQKGRGRVAPGDYCAWCVGGSERCLNLPLLRQELGI